ncbi:hypothetical protein ACIBG0_41660 [Nocardia sp. NPDC050630]|uniref:hypothetical protein n=1 Tax=Nocardia sp. NPDC050630 TaxID=3364321 RepID=UPI0037AEAB6B
MQVGAYAAAVPEHPLPWTTMRQVYRLLGLVRRHVADAVDEAGRRSLDAEVVDVGVIDRMLTRATIAQQLTLLPATGAVPVHPVHHRFHGQEAAPPAVPPPPRRSNRSWSPRS